MTSRGAGCDDPYREGAKAKPPRATVVIPTYNRADLLAETVESVLRQSYTDREVIVCDDGSTDDTPARVREFGGRVRYYRLAHTGCPGAPRNLGIRAARGELIAFVDDDDLWETETLGRQVELVDRCEANLVYTDRRVLRADGSISGTVASPQPASADGFLDLLLEGQFPSVCTALMHRSLLRQVGGFDETLVTGEDLDLWLRVAPAVRVARVPEALVLVRRRPGTLSDRSGAAAYSNTVRLFERSLASGQLQRAQQRRCRATLARLNLRLAALHNERGDTGPAILASLRAVRHAPVSPAAWRALAKSGSIDSLRSKGPGAERGKS